VATTNYAIGRTTLYFAEGQALGSPSVHMDDPVSLGNIVTTEITPAPTYQEHYVSIKGCRRKDKDVVIDYKLTVPFTFDEVNSTNLQKFMLGGDVSASKMVVFRKPKLEGRAIIQFNTDVGREFLYVIPKCCLRSDGGIPLQADDWVRGNFNLDILYHSTYRMNNTTAASLCPYGYMQFDDADAIASPF